MALDIRFGASTNEVNVNKSYGAASRDAQRDEGNYEDWAGALGKGIQDVSKVALDYKKAEDTINKAQIKSDSQQAKVDYNEGMNKITKEFPDATDTMRADYICLLYTSDAADE